jgi:hypothetical protein
LIARIFRWTVALVPETGAGTGKEGDRTMGMRISAARMQSPKMICRPGGIFFREPGDAGTGEGVIMDHLHGCTLPDGRAVRYPLMKNQINTTMSEKMGIFGLLPYRGSPLNARIPTIL